MQDLGESGHNLAAGRVSAARSGLVPGFTAPTA